MWNAGASASRVTPQALHGGQQQPEAGDGHGVGIHVHAVNAIQGSLDQLPDVGPRLFRCQRSKIRAKAAQQEVPAAAGRVDHAEGAYSRSCPSN